MKKTDINKALKKRLEDGVTSMEGVWPNVDPQDKSARPYFEVVFPQQADRGVYNLRGTLVQETGSMQVIIVTELGAGERVGYELGDAIADLFPAATRIPIDNGLVTVSQAPSIRNGYRDGSDWRTPVAIPYTARSQ